jgi:hypothetical protein
MDELSFEIRGTGSLRRQTHDPRRATLTYLLLGASAVLVASGKWPSNPQASLTLSPAAFDFGLRPVGAAPLLQMFTLGNSGAGPAVLGQFRLAGEHAEAFELRTLSCSGQSLPAKSQCQVAVAFSPSHVGTQSARIELVNAAGGVMQSARLMGAGRAPVAPPPPPPPPPPQSQPAILKVDPEFKFAPVVLGGQAALSVVLSNVGGEELQISGAHMETEGPIQLASPFEPVRISPNNASNLDVVFRPEKAGRFQATLLVDSNTQPSLVRVQLYGTASPPPVPRARLTLNPPQFGVPGTIAIATVTNVGEGMLTLGRAVIQGNYAKMFLIREDKCWGRSLRTDESCQVQAYFVGPARAGFGEFFGAAKALLVIEDNTAEKSSSVELVGGADRKPPTAGTYVPINPNALKFREVQKMTQPKPSVLQPPVIK